MDRGSTMKPVNEKTSLETLNKKLDWIIERIEASKIDDRVTFSFDIDDQTFLGLLKLVDKHPPKKGAPKREK